MSNIIVLPLATMKKFDSENLPYQWFAEVWKQMNSNKLNLSDDIIQKIFEAQGKGREAQKAFYLKYGIADVLPIVVEDEPLEEELEEEESKPYFADRERSNNKMKKNEKRGMKKVLKIGVWMSIGIFIIAHGLASLIDLGLIISLIAIVKGSFKPFRIKNRKTATILFLVFAVLCVINEQNSTKTSAVTNGPTAIATATFEKGEN